MGCRDLITWLDHGCGVQYVYEDLLNLAVEHALKLGASYAEARYHRNETTSIVMREDRVVGTGLEVREGIAVRVLYRGVLAFASTEELNSESVRKAVEIAIARARALESKEFLHGLAPARLGRAKYEVVMRKSFDYEPIDVKISRMKELFRIAKNSASKAKLSSFAIEYGESIETKHIVTSDGGDVESTIPRVYMLANIVLSDPQRGTMQRMIELGASGGLEKVEEWNLPSKISEEVRAIEKMLLEGVAPPREPVPVVVGSEVVGLIVHESAGHPMEADRVWGREAAQAGESFVKPDMVGKESVGNELATVVDDPTIPGSFGFYLYDDEAVPARPKYIYFRGKLNEMLHNRWSAFVFGVESNGSARAMDFASEPIPRMSNTYLTPGDRTFEELIEDIELGVYIKSYMEWNIDDVRWGQRYVGLEAYMIRKGELAEPVRNPVLEITTKSFYSLIEAKTKEVRFYAGICGKGEPAQGVPVWFGGPDVRLGKILLGVVPT